MQSLITEHSQLISGRRVAHKPRPKLVSSVKLLVKKGMSQDHQDVDNPLIVNLDTLQTITKTFDRIRVLRDPIEREYTFIEMTKQFDIPLDSLHQMFRTYCLAQEEKQALSSWWKSPLFRLEKRLESFARFLDGMDIFKIIGKLASLSIILGVITFVAEIPQRAEREKTEQKRANYEAWQIIRSNQGQLANGGRIDALQDLHKNGIKLSDINVAKANLNDINLNGAQLEDADLSETTLHRANLSRTNLHFSNLRKSEGFNTNLSEANLFVAKLDDAVFFNPNLNKADLRRASLRNTQLSAADLRGANLEGANLIDAKLMSDENNMEVDLTGANLKNILFSKSTIFPPGFDPAKHNAHLVGPGAKLKDISLSQFDLGEVDLTGADLTNANLTETNLSKVKGLTVEQVKKAEYWEGAKYEPGFRKKLGLLPE